MWVKKNKGGNETPHPYKAGIVLEQSVQAERQAEHFKTTMAKSAKTNNT